MLCSKRCIVSARFSVSFIISSFLFWLLAEVKTTGSVLSSKISQVVCCRCDIQVISVAIAYRVVMVKDPSMSGHQVMVVPTLTLVAAMVIQTVYLPYQSVQHQNMARSRSIQRSIHQRWSPHAAVEIYMVKVRLLAVCISMCVCVCVCVNVSMSLSVNLSVTISDCFTVCGSLMQSFYPHSLVGVFCSIY